MSIIGRITGLTSLEEYALYLGIFAQKLAILERDNSFSPVPFIANMLSVTNIMEFNKLKLHDLASICKELNHVANGYPELTGNVMTYEEFVAIRRDKKLHEMGI